MYTCELQVFTIGRADVTLNNVTFEHADGNYHDDVGLAAYFMNGMKSVKESAVYVNGSSASEDLVKKWLCNIPGNLGKYYYNNMEVAVSDN